MDKKLISKIDELLKMYTEEQILNATKTLSNPRINEIFKILWSALEDEEWTNKEKTLYKELEETLDPIHTGLILVRLEIAKLKAEGKIND